MSEADARIIIDKLLRDSGWVLPGDDGNVNVEAEVRTQGGVADYVLKDSSDFPLCVIEAKKKLISPLVGKEQARAYAESLNCRFVVLSNSVKHYFWDIEQGEPNQVSTFFSPEQLKLRKASFNPPRQQDEEIDSDYIAKTQMPDFKEDPDYLDDKKKADFIKKYRLRLLRDYQLNAVKAVQKRVREGKDRFLLEMATGTGKTLVSSAIIKMFLRLYKVKRILFLVDRLELAAQALKEFNEALQNDFRTVIWKEHRSDWNKAEIIVSTIQSFISGNKYRRIFKPDNFGLVISDEAHRSLGSRSLKVFEYFIGFKLGLTATPKNYLKSIDGLAEVDPRQLEQRQMLDTYRIFGCESSDPTYRYSLEDGVRDQYLVNPKVIDARTEITTPLLSKQGYFFQGVDEEGNDIEETFTRKDFEKTFFSKNTNTIFCKIFLENAKRDPYTGEIGKTLIFCVSQKHASMITQILNSLANTAFPSRYKSDFAMQVTSNISNSQYMTVDFRNNSLCGHSSVNSCYSTSKTRVCVTVGMMTTGYDCPDILNICMMRPVFSPSEFIQIKGRGTRKYDFSLGLTTSAQAEDYDQVQKKEFLLFDFFANYEYFENEFDYDQILKMPSESDFSSNESSQYIDQVISSSPDYLTKLKQIIISDDGMRIDRDLYSSFKNKMIGNKTVKNLVVQNKFNEAETYLINEILNKPSEFFTIDKLGKSLGLDRQLTVRELLLFVYGHIKRLYSQRECLDEEFDKFDNELSIDDTIYSNVKEVFEAYATDEDFRGIIDSRQLANLNVHPSGIAYNELPNDMRELIPSFINQKVDIQRLQNVG